MIPIEFDFSSIRDEFSLNQNQIDSLLDYSIKELTAAFASEWEKQAAEELHSSRELYMRSIIVTDPGKFMGAVELTNDVPNMIESGSPAFDMKPHLLGGEKVKISKSGSKYTTVPFRIGTPGTLSENFSTIMPEPVYEAVKNKPFEVETSGGIRTKGLTSGEIPKKYRTPITKFVELPDPGEYSAVWKKYTHKSSIYEGIIRQKSNITGQNTYMSFRRVSENSDLLAWIHPGMTARNLAEKALDRLDMPNELTKSIDGYLEKLGYESY